MNLYKIEIKKERDDTYYCTANSYDDAFRKSKAYFEFNKKITDVIVNDSHGSSQINPDLYDDDAYNIVSIRLLTDKLIQ
jgi:hypothetical protein